MRIVSFEKGALGFKSNENCSFADSVRNSALFPLFRHSVASNSNGILPTYICMFDSQFF